MRWLNEIETANTAFQHRIDTHSLPIDRKPCPYALITCMDPRINLEAVGIPSFTASGASRSDIRVIRTIGAIHETRSLTIGIHLAGFQEIAVLMHSDCGCCLAHQKIDVIEHHLEQRLSQEKLARVKTLVEHQQHDPLRAWLKTFEDPREAVKREVSAIRESPFVPEAIVVHGLVYDLSSGAVDVVVNGYQTIPDT